MAEFTTPNATQVATLAPGSSVPLWLGEIGRVQGLSYGSNMPGGDDQLTCTLQVPATFRDNRLNPGRTVQAYRGGHIIWRGKLDEPAPTATGWQITAIGSGQLGTDYVAHYTSTWPGGEPDQAINNAITRGLPWTNPGVGTPAGAWYGQAPDDAATTITSLLNLVCTRGALTWFVDSTKFHQPNTLSVFALPTAVDRLLVSTQPVPRTLGGDINTIWIKYQVTADSTTTNATATYATTSVQNAASVAAHGVIETYIDLSDVGVQSTAAAQAVGTAVLAIYQRASFNGPFTVAQGQVLTTGGQPVDNGMEKAGHVYRLLLTDFGYGGEVTPAPITFIGGAVTWDDQNQTGSVTPYQSVDTSLSGLLQLKNSELTAVKVA
ncbi:MAG TPA: hypothetical protein VGI66_03570 [Streptosporangiaceae bacterium]|jgi:hypothetical protein